MTYTVGVTVTVFSIVEVAGVIVVVCKMSAHRHQF